MAVYYGYKGAIYTAEELNEEYGKLVEAEKKAVHRRHKEYEVIDIKIDKVFKKLYNKKVLRLLRLLLSRPAQCSDVFPQSILNFMTA